MTPTPKLKVVNFQYQATFNFQKHMVKYFE